MVVTGVQKLSKALELCLESLSDIATLLLFMVQWMYVQVFVKKN